MKHTVFYYLPASSNRLEQGMLDMYHRNIYLSLSKPSSVPDGLLRITGGYDEYCNGRRVIRGVLGDQLLHF